jgi:glycosyltransferase involved in cell wall biosynthesis
LKISILNSSDSSGGAARAAYRIHQALRRNGIDSSLLVNESVTGDWTVSGPQSRQMRLFNKLRGILGYSFNLLHTSGNPIIHSLALIPSKWPKQINTSSADLIHMIWINNEMMSIKDVAKIKKPLIWTLQDMWAFCGAEHVTEDRRYLEGYSKQNRPNYESGIDINRFTWARKKKVWKTPINIVAPSSWMADRVRSSELMKTWPVTVIANPIDIDRWFPVNKPLARELLCLPVGVPLLLFGTSGANNAPHKGFDLLKKSIKSLVGKLNMHLVIFGEFEPEKLPNFGFPVHYMGYMRDDLTMQVLYSAADIVAIPSRVDNLPNVGIESLACGTPVLAFNTCGLPDIVRHKETGYLASAFDVDDFANGVLWLLEDKDRHALISKNARNDAVERFSYPVIASKYQALYESVIVASKTN